MNRRTLLLCMAYIGWGLVGCARPLANAAIDPDSSRIVGRKSGGSSTFNMQPHDSQVSSYVVSRPERHWKNSSLSGRISWVESATHAQHSRHSKRHRHRHNYRDYRDGDDSGGGGFMSDRLLSKMFVDIDMEESEEAAVSMKRHLQHEANVLHWPVKKVAIMEGDVILGGLMMVHSREDLMMCGPIMPQGGIQALEVMMYTLDRINRDRLLPNITVGAHILDDCDRDSYGLEMAVDFIKGKH